jgi:hypothetical protein
MNKTGYSMYWNSMWDDKLNYTRSFKEDILIRMFFNLFIEGGYTFVIRHKIVDIDKHLNFLKSQYGLHILKKKKDETHYNYFLDTSKTSEQYISRIWLLKYQNWVIFYFFTFSFDSSTFSKKKIIKKATKQYFNLVSNYYHNLLKLDYNYDFYKNYSSQNNRFSF